MKMNLEVEGKKFEVEYDGDNEKEVELAFKGLHEFLEKFDYETDECSEDEDDGKE